MWLISWSMRAARSSEGQRAKQEGKSSVNLLLQSLPKTVIRSMVCMSQISDRGRKSGDCRDAGVDSNQERVHGHEDNGGRLTQSTLPRNQG